MPYLAIGPPPFRARNLNNENVPHDTWDCFKIAWKTWSELSGPQDLNGARYVFKPHILSFADTDKLNKWVGIGKTPQAPAQADMGKLLCWHNELCDAVQSRTSAPYVPEDPERNRIRRGFDPWYRVESQYLMLAPTFRAALMIARAPMAPEMHVLLVLTGQNQEMSKPPTFDSIPLEQLEAYRSKSMVQVSFLTAMQYLHVLEKTEETANSAFRAKNEGRKRVIYQELTNQANFEVELLRRECGRKRRRMLKRSDHRNKHKHRLAVKLANARGCTIDAWKEVVADEKVLITLSETAALSKNTMEEYFGISNFSDPCEIV